LSITTIQLFSVDIPYSERYWKKRYLFGGNSGLGSYGKLASFKAAVINKFVEENKIETVIEYGCGDGNQLRLAHYPSYIGFDVSLDAVLLCRTIFSEDDAKLFKLMGEYSFETADLTLSLDVIFHLLEDEVFDQYMQRLFNSSNRFVIIYSSNTDEQKMAMCEWVKHRKFTDWADNNMPEWELARFIPNKYQFIKYGEDSTSSFSDFYIYIKRESKLVCF